MMYVCKTLKGIIKNILKTIQTASSNTQNIWANIYNLVRLGSLVLERDNNAFNALRIF